MGGPVGEHKTEPLGCATHPVSRSRRRISSPGLRFYKALTPRQRRVRQLHCVADSFCDGGK